jgi:hypothetical protein
LRGAAEQQSKCERPALTFAKLRGKAEQQSEDQCYALLLAKRSEANPQRFALIIATL